MTDNSRGSTRGSPHEARFAELEARFEERFAELEAKIAASEARLLHLIEGTSQSLQREIANLAEMLAEIQRRLDRQAGLIQTGARQTTRFSRWSEQVDRART